MKPLKWNFKTAALTAAVFFVSWSFFSGYRFDRVSSFNWDIAVMLTPYGIIKNTLLDSSHYLYPYYFKTMQLPPDHSFFPVILFILIQVFLSLTALKLFKKENK